MEFCYSVATFFLFLLCHTSALASEQATPSLVEFRFGQTLVGSLLLPAEYRIFVENGSTKKVGDKIIAATQDGTAMNAYISPKKYGEEEVWKHWVLSAHVGHIKVVNGKLAYKKTDSATERLTTINDNPKVLLLVAESNTTIDGVNVNENITRQKKEIDGIKYSYADFFSGVSRCAYFDLEMELETSADPPGNLTLEKIREQTKPLMDIIKTYKVSYDGCPPDST